MSSQTIRTTAAQITYEVVYKKHNLSNAFNQRLHKNKSPEYKSATKALCFDTIRHFLTYEDIWSTCLDKKPKDKLVRVILTQALTEFYGMNKPSHAVVNEAINTAKKLNKNWAKGLINSCLRKAISIEKPTNSNPVAEFAHPQWWIDTVKKDWPNHWQQILTANNQKPPLWIRSESAPPKDLEAQRHHYILSAYKIAAQDVTKLPEFKNGKISVQDASAQLAGYILDPQNDDRILDACSAPGGKTGHLLELNNNIHVDALELYPNRAKKISENLKRLNLTANILVADTKKTSTWFRGLQYDKVLLDAPCSASGIVRRHPDIKFVRQLNDLKDIYQDQQQLLNATAKVLKAGGTLLYATCSVFNAENSDQIEIFLKTHPEFNEIKLNYTFAENCKYGIQILPGNEDSDGFYYCYLRKDDI
ncbi:MAG: 16S rRNA (cytosine(967)-C(5))-methyltransferase RsmB [Marinicellaceae bacterium]